MQRILSRSEATILHVPNYKGEVKGPGCIATHSAEARPAVQVTPVQEHSDVLLFHPMTPSAAT